MLRWQCEKLSASYGKTGRKKSGSDSPYAPMTIFGPSITLLAHARGVRERDSGYPGIGFIYVEWEHSASDSLLQKVSDRFAKLADERDSSDAARADARDRRFEALVLALMDCRKDGLFAEDTLLCVGSTDPSKHLEALAMRAVERLNLPRIADQFAEHLGYEKHRKKA